MPGRVAGHRRPGSPWARTHRTTRALHAYVKNLANSFFLQDSYSPNKLRNLTINAGVRLELQKMYGSDGNAVFSTDNLSPRLSAVYDPFNDGRSKLAVSYGRYYEAVPLDVAARYFAGENFVNSSMAASPPATRATSATPTTGPATASTRSAAPRPARLRSSTAKPRRRTSRGSTTTRSSPPPSARFMHGHDPAPRLPAPLAGEHHRGRLRPGLQQRARQPRQRAGSAITPPSNACSRR